MRSEVVVGFACRVRAMSPVFQPDGRLGEVEETADDAVLALIKSQSGLQYADRATRA